LRFQIELELQRRTEMKSAIRNVGFLIVLAALGSFASAQGASSGVTGTGAAGQITVWVGTHQIGNSVIRQDSDSTIVVDSSLVVFNGLSGSVASGSAGGVEGHSSSEFGTGVFGSATSTIGGTAGVLGLSASSEGSGVRGISTNIAILGRNEICTSSCVFAPGGTAGVFATGTGGTLLSGFVGDSGGPIVGGSIVFRVDSTGKGFFDGGTQTGGADFAESVAVAIGRNHYGPADVLVLDPTADSQLTLANKPYSTLVAGIYSTKPGVLASAHKMDAPISVGEIPLAIVGIVPCKVSAENGPIRRGELLVTSSTPGYAMRGTDRGRMLGAVVGKAMEPLEKGTGVIQVLVTLQ
jgi:hypothetical protein